MQTDEFYYYCTTHEKCVLVEEKDKHSFPDCNYIIQPFTWSPPKNRKKEWVAKSVVEREGMIVYHYKPIKILPNNTLPDDAIRIDRPDFIPRKL